MEQSEIQTWLKRDLARRCRTNPKYSLRAYAKFIGMDPSTLSKMINGQRTIGSRSARRIFERVGPPPVDKNTVDSSLGTHDFESIGLDDFNFISEWYHYAILELMHTDDFVPSDKFVAKKLGLSIHEVRDAMSRMERIGLITIDTRGRWLDRSSGTTTTIKTPFSAPALRQHQRAILEKAIDALERVDFSQRDQTSITVAIDSRKIPEAKERIKRFRRELSDFLSSGNRKDHVYQMSFSLFPIT